MSEDISAAVEPLLRSLLRSFIPNLVSELDYIKLQLSNFDKRDDHESQNEIVVIKDEPCDEVICGDRTFTGFSNHS